MAFNVGVAAFKPYFKPRRLTSFEWSGVKHVSAGLCNRGNLSCGVTTHASLPDSLMDKSEFLKCQDNITCLSPLCQLNFGGNVVGLNLRASFLVPEKRNLNASAWESPFGHDESKVYYGSVGWICYRRIWLALISFGMNGGWKPDSLIQHQGCNAYRVVIKLL